MPSATYTAYGNTGLPVIAANDNLTVLGDGDTIERSTAAGTPDFRLLRVASGGSLTLENLTLQGGMITSVRMGSGLARNLPTILNGGADGAAIYTQGTLDLNGVTVQDNVAGVSGITPIITDSAGGGIFSDLGSVTLEGGTIVQNNEALGSVGGNAYGGGLFASGGTVTVTNGALDNNTAVSDSGSAFGGGLFAGSSGMGSQTTVVTLTNATLDGNAATFEGYTSGIANSGNYGGGLYLSSLGTATATLTNCTVQGNSTLTNSGASKGGGLYLFGSTAILTNCTVQGNSAVGLNASPEGGGLYVASGTVTLVNDTVQGNSTLNLAYSNYGGAAAASTCVSGATVHLDAFTVANTINNTDGTGLNGSTANIDCTVISPLSPTVVTAASANPSPVTGTTTNLTVLGADAAGAASLTYTWAVTSVPAGAATPTFSNNGSNASQNTTATFYRAGTYTFQATITDPSGLTAASSVTVNVLQTYTTLSLMPGTVTLVNGATQQFVATGLDQFGQGYVWEPWQPPFTWQISRGGGTINSDGLYTAPARGTGNFLVSVSALDITGTASVTIPALPPVITQPASANQNPVTGNQTQLQVQASDPQGSNLTYVWSVTSQPNGAKTPTFNNANNNNTNVIFYQAGSYTFTATVQDSLGLVTTSSVTVTVTQTLTSLSVTPANVTLAEGATQQFTATALDQFGQAMASQPNFTWQVNGGGTISSTGLYTAPASRRTGLEQVRVSADGKNAQADVTVVL